MSTVYLASSSKVKIRTFTELLEPSGYSVQPLAVAVGEVQDVDVRKVCRQKAAEAARLTPQRPLLVDDTGLELPDLAGAPGALLKPLLEHGGVALLERMTRGFQDTGLCRARYVCGLVWVEQTATEEAVGSWDGWLDFSGQAGEVSADVRDCSALFRPDRCGPTLSEQAARIGAAAYLHRDRALKVLMEQLALVGSRSS